MLVYAYVFCVSSQDMHLRLLKYRRISQSITKQCFHGVCVVINFLPPQLVAFFYLEVIEDAPHRRTVPTIPKQLRAFFYYDRKLNTLLPS